MRVLIARFLLVFAVLGLPFQAVASVTMSLCDRDQHHGVVADGQDKVVHCAHDGQPPCSGVVGDTVLCHYCAVAALPTVPSAVTFAATSVRTPAATPHLFLYFPELPKRPPVA